MLNEKNNFKKFQNKNLPKKNYKNNDKEEDLKEDIKDNNEVTKLEE